MRVDKRLGRSLVALQLVGCGGCGHKLVEADIIVAVWIKSVLRRSVIYSKAFLKPSKKL